MSSLLFQSQNRVVLPPKKVVAHPYIYSQEGGTVTIGVYCEEPAPVDAIATVWADLDSMGSTYAQVEIRKGMLDSGIRTRVMIPVIPSNLLRFYKFTTLRITEFDKDFFLFGPKIVCPTMVFNLELRVDISDMAPLDAGDFINPFGSGGVELVPTNTLFDSADLSDVTGLEGPGAFYSYRNTVEVSRAAAMQVVPQELEVMTDFRCESSLSSYSGTILHNLLYDTSQKYSETKEMRFGSEYPYIGASLGRMSMGQYVQAGVTIFTIRLEAKDIVPWA